MRYFLSQKLISEIIYGSDEIKNKIIETVSFLIKNEKRIYTSVISIEKILNSQKLQSSNIFLKQIEIICDKIYPLELDDCTLRERLFGEYSCNRELLLEFAICIRRNIDIFLTTEQIDLKQNLIVVQRVTLESK